MYTYNEEKKIIEDMFSDKPHVNMRDVNGDLLPAADANGKTIAGLLNEYVYGIVPDFKQKK